MSPRVNDQIDEVIVRKAPIFLGLDSAAADALRSSMSLVNSAKDNHSSKKAMMEIISMLSLMEK